MGLQRNDILWKGTIEDFFPDFLRFTFKDADNIFDFTKGFTFLDKELTELFPEQDVKHPKFIDKLVRVYTKGGKAKWLLIHIEVQGYHQSKFTQRMFTYYSRLIEKYKIPVTCVVIYLGKRNKSNASFYETECFGTKLRLDFNTYYVGEQNEEELKKNRNPFAIIVLTALIALKHKKNIEQLFNSKMTLARNLLEAGFDKQKTRKLFNFIKLYIHFEENELNFKFDDSIKLLTNKNSQTMGILEQVRELLKEQIRDEGIREGKREGESKTKISIARKMKKLGVSASIIAKSTDLSISKIRTL